MAKRGYKLQEFVAHTGSLNCLTIGKKTRRLFITGGDDHKVNLWSIGKPTSLMSMSGHASPVESLAFDSAEVLVLAGASSGIIKLWDLEETKMVRTLTGHRSNCTSVEFHPFGEFFASGAMDTNLKIWDIRKKGCIHTYKGHTRGISTIKFTPDGRWVVSGGFDNVVKVWDLTAGKLLHDFKFHEGHIRSIDFHPLEFLLATGSADMTVKFWDLETFELIGSARPEATGVRSVTFHPDGRTLFCGFDDSLKVYSWEPVICHDALDMGWSTLGDLCINDGKLLGCSYYRNSVAVWAADISHIEPYGAGITPEQKSQSEQKYDPHESPMVKVGSHRRTGSNVRCPSPDYETKEIKNIYIDTAGGNPVSSKRVGSYSSGKVIQPSDSKEIKNLPLQKQGPTSGVQVKTAGQTNTKSFIAPNVLSRDGPDGKDSVNSRRESITSSRASAVISVKTPHMRRPSATKIDMERLSVPDESESISKTTDGTALDPCVHGRLVADDDAKETSGGKHLNIGSVTHKLENIFSPQMPSGQENSNKFPDANETTNSVRYVNGVAVVRGRTRSLVERFERREKLNGDGYGATDTTTPPDAICMVETFGRREKLNGDECGAPDTTPSDARPEIAKASPKLNTHPQIITAERELSVNDCSITEELMQKHDVYLSNLRSRLTKLQVVRHFWERNDIKGAIDAMRKLPDHSVQADVVSVLMEKMEIITLDLFSCLLPVLLGLLDSKIERHANISLDMLLKLVAVFGPVVHSTISAPPAVGVDLHQEQRIECCNQCFIQLQKIRKILPLLIRRGGLLAKSAQQLNLVLQDS